MEVAKVIVREVKPEDKDLVMKTWLMGNYWGNWHFNQMDQDEYYKLYKAHIIGIFLTPETKVDVAVLSEIPDMVLGYIVYRGPIIFWAFTKPDYRGKGILNLLLENKNITIAAGITKPGAPIARKKGFLINPLLT